MGLVSAYVIYYDESTGGNIRMIEMKEIQCFLECADTKSFTKAAERLYTSQSNVSKRIKSLEETTTVLQ